MMPPSALLDLCCRLLARVLAFDAPADSVVSTFFREHRQIGQRERHALAETVYAVLRRRLLYAHLAQSGRGAVERRLAALAWAGDPQTLRSALGPQESAWLAQAQAVDLADLPAKLHHNLPDWLAGALQKEMGEAAFEPFARAMLESAPMDVRVNRLKGERASVQTALAEAGIASAPTPHSPWGLRIEGKPNLARQPLFTEGLIEVQDEGSQLICALVGAKRGEMVADFCAGAGGKTLALGAMMRSTGRLYALDVSAHRLQALKPRLARSGLSNVHPVQIASERDERIKRLAGKFDRVLVDAPCSGLGTLRRNPDLKWRQSPTAVTELTAKQTAILNAAARLIKPGGRLVYATCSPLQAENEDIAAAFEQASSGFVRLDARVELERAQVEGADALSSPAAMRLSPDHHQTDGFFACAWQRQ